MGILNITPDSFYAESRVTTIEAAVRRGVQMVADGATFLDVGGESTRPGATPVSAEEERSRVIPVIEALRQQLPEVFISVDTRHLDVARAAVLAGADIYNDVEATHINDEKSTFIAASGVGYVVMDAQGKWDAPLHALQSKGVNSDQLVLDVGLGFQASTDEAIHQFARTHDYATSRYPYLIAASRKRFIGFLTQQEKSENRGAGSVSAALWAVTQGANILRIHDVRATADALKVFLTMKRMTTHV